MEKEGYPAGPSADEMKGAIHMGAGHPPQYHETEGAVQQQHPHGYPPQGAPMGAPQGYPQGPPIGAPQGYPQGPPMGAPQGYPQGPPMGAPQGYPQGPPMGAPQGYSQGPPMGAPQGYPQGPYQKQPHGTPAPSSTLYPAGTQQTIVIQQGLAPTEYVESYLAWSIINCLCCCWILGIIAIVMSCTARSDNDAGNIEAAKSHAKAAFGLNVAGTLIGVLAIIIIIILQVV